MRRVFIPIAATVLLLVLGLIGAEVLAQGYAYFVAEKGKRFQPDERLGWIVIPNLEIRHKNPDGDTYHIRTDALSIRGPSRFPASQNILRMLVVGDSFAFGEGVNLEDRFDTLLMEQVPTVATVNVGVPGYGTDQQVLRAREYLPLIKNGDVVLILVYGNDFHDVARTRNSGRSKPWYTLSGDSLILHNPDIGLVERMREKSYLFSVFASKFEHDPLYEERLTQSLDIVRAFLKTFSAEVKSRGAELWIALHGLEAFKLPIERNTVKSKVCNIADRCFDLDPILAEPGFFLNDRHWSADGHRAVAKYLASRL